MKQKIELLNKRYPFPQNKPDLKSFYWSLDGGGREIIKEIIVEQNISLMLEIGVFFGGSAKQWLDSSSQLTLIGVDPFPNLSGYFAKSYERYQQNMILGEHTYESLMAQLQLENGTYLSVINNLWDYRDRFIPIPKKSPDILYELNYYQIAPALIYIDSNHQLDELAIIHKIFPQAIVTGNAWTWKQGDRLPVQEKVTAFAQQHGYEIMTEKGSWVLRQPNKSATSNSLTSTASLTPENQSPNNNLAKSDYIQVRNGLPGLEAKLKQDVCKIAYLGASVTAQKKGYRPNLHQWLQSHYQQPHVQVNGAIGGVISGAAVFLMDDTVVQYQPDICFIEYSTVDMSWNSPEISYAIEGMVRKLQAIGCQVCFLYLYRRDRQYQTHNPVIEMYEEIAEFYRLPSINIGKYIESCLDAKSIVFNDLYRDFVHTHPAGGEFLGTQIADALKVILAANPNSAQLPENEAENGNSKSYLYSDIYAQGQVVPIKHSMIPEGDQYEVDYFHDPLLDKKYQYYQIDSSSQIEFIIKGKLMAILAVVGREAGIVEFITQKQTWEYSFWDTHCHYDRINAKPVYRAFDDYTAVVLRLSAKLPDYSTCRRTIERPEAIAKNFKIIGLLVSGEVLSPNHKVATYDHPASRLLH